MGFGVLGLKKKKTKKKGVSGFVVYWFLGSTKAAEIPSSAANKESSECSNFNFQPLPEPNQKSQVSESNVIDAESKVDVNPPPESSAATVCFSFENLDIERTTVTFFLCIYLFCLVNFRLRENCCRLRV